jgi:hypothetical protein
MTRGCEVCASLSQSTGALVTSRRRGVYRVLMPERLLILCAEHAAEVESTRALTLDELRGRFLEPFPGQRSLIPRRTLHDKNSDSDRRRSGRRAGE